MTFYVNIWTDGSCYPNPGPGGWAAILRCEDWVKRVYGGVPYTTNNQMEMMAAIKGLATVKPNMRSRTVVCLRTDSQYLRNGFTRWLPTWKKRGWRNAEGKPVSNRPLWEQLETVVADFERVQWEWVRGHSGHKFNEEADQLALQGRLQAMGGE